MEKRIIYKGMSKQQIYAAFGIEYDPKAGKILSPVFGWINPLLIDGNTKLGKGVWTFSTLAGNGLYNVYIDGAEYAVKGTCVCTCSGCYAMTGRYRMQTCIVPNARKTILARLHMEFVKAAIIAQIHADKIEYLRVHASGDFFSMEYVNMWRDIIQATPKTVYWTYTKVKEAENAFDDLPNANIVKSVIPGKGANYGHCDYILSCYDFLKEAGKSVYICRCGVDKNQHCTNCKGCSRNDYVLFIEHSTGYIAEKDPLFPVLKNVINSQVTPE